MFEELRRLLGQEAGLPSLGQEELLDILWLAARVPSGPAAPLAAHIPSGTDPESPDAEGSLPGAEPDPDATAPPGSTAGKRPGNTRRTARPVPQLPVVSGPLTAEPPTGALWTPGARALGPTLALGRALRPLKRRVPSRRRSELDEAASADLQADTRTPQLVLRAQPERWLRLTLIIDGGVSMPLWQRQCAELQGLFERSGAFRQVETYQIRYDTGGAEVRLGRPWTAATPTRPADTVSDTAGRTMVLVVTDGAAAAWRDGRLRPVLEAWARCGPTAVLHTLPRRLWAGSGVRADSWQVVSPRPGAANTAWTVTDQVLPPSVAPPPPVPVPVLELTPAGFSTWAALNTVVGRPVPARLWASEPSQAPAAPVRVSVRDFARAASPEALRLAAHLAAMAPVTVPVMQLVHSCLDQRQDTAPLAEVFLGGLIQPVEPEDTGRTGRHRLFDFTPEAKDLLLDAVPTAELLDCSRRVGERIESLTGRSSDFPAWPLDRDETGEAAPFAYLGPAMQARLGVPGSAADGVVLSPHTEETASGWGPGEASVELPRWDYVMNLVDRAVGSSDEPPAAIRSRLRERYVDVLLSRCPEEVRSAFARVRGVPQDADVLLLHLLGYVHDEPAATRKSEAEIAGDLLRYLDERGLRLERDRSGEAARRHDVLWQEDGWICPVAIRRAASPFGWRAPWQDSLTGPAFLLAVDDDDKPDGRVPFDECVVAWPDRSLIGLRLQNRAPTGSPGAPGTRRICIAVDIVGYGKMDRRTGRRMQEALHDVLDLAMRMTGVPRRLWVRQDRGDGTLVLLPHGVDEARAVRGFVDGLTQGLRHVHERGVRMRVRAALALGAAGVSERGAGGEAVLHVARLADSAVLRGSRADCALIVSESLYESVPELHGRLQRVRIEEKALRTWAWLRPDPPGLPDPDRSNAVLIGVGAYTELPRLPQVGVGLRELSLLLTDPSEGTFSGARTTVLPDPDDGAAVLGVLAHAAISAEDTLLVYFAGHGLYDSVSGELSLALRRSRPYAPVTGVPFDDIRRVVLGSAARHKIVILDCCYSGPPGSRGVPGVFNAVPTDDVTVLAASAPPGDGCMALTGELVDVLAAGLDDGSEVVSLRVLHQELRHRLRAAGLPEPTLGSHDNGEIALARNRAR
ncbi:SAV_2336 N-terminal domain-related protein [Streptomyces sp. NPDC005820]|uniref:caspase, EACC1-associated type n=1 Tax=Streptomyces sp. NPDC005820 TaxID=3157069 RepID=UPI0033DC9D68